ncbi:MAG: hypothetical protein ABJD68_06405 [Nakamurella sp.]
MTDEDTTDQAKLRRTPNIADRYADLLATLSQRQRHAIIVRLTTGFYEGWHPSRSEIADLVAVELGLLTIEESLERQRLRNRGKQPPDYSTLILARNRNQG